MAHDTRTLQQIHAQLMENIHCCDNMIDPDSEGSITLAVWADGTECEVSEVHEMTHMSDDYETIDEQELLNRQLAELCKELNTIEEVSALKWAVDCDCFYSLDHKGA